MTDPASGKRQLSLAEVFARGPAPTPDPPIKYVKEAIEETAIVSASSQAPRPSDFERTWPRPKVACVDCGGLIVLRWGEERRPHFAHLNPSGAATGCCGGESLMHSLAKTLLARHLNANRRVRLCYDCPRCTRQATRDLDLTSLPNAVASEEYTLASGARVDVCVHALGASPVVAIEIFHSHRSLSAPRRDLLWFEVRAEHVVTALESDIDATLLELKCQRKDRDPCNNAMCMDTHEIAKLLGYRMKITFYGNDNLREKDAAVRGRYRLPLEVWQTSPDDRDDSDDEGEDVDGYTNTYDVDDLWHEFVRRRHCMRCLRSGTTGRHRPFCLKCYKLIKRENETDDMERCEWQEVEESRKAHLREKFKWLKYFQTSSPGLTCQVCESDTQGYTWWFGTRRICEECFAAWTPDKTQCYVRKVQVEDSRRRASQTGILYGF